MIDFQGLFDARKPQFDLFWAEHQSSSDRAICVLGGSLVETRTEGLLLAYLMQDKLVTNELLGDGQPLGTFAVQTKLAFVLGLITSDTFKQLTLVRRIRNHAAHQVHVAFSVSPIKDHCLSLGYKALAEQLQTSTASFAGAATEKISFFLAVTSLMTHLDVWAQTIAEHHRRRPLFTYTSSPGKQLGTA